jgi:hypothetical protein
MACRLERQVSDNRHIDILPPVVHSHFFFLK